MINPYENCPVFETQKYRLRFVEVSDAPDLLRVYSDEMAVPYFNSDNCGGDDFYYTSLERTQRAIVYWHREYDRQGFIRWSVVDKSIFQVIGTIELFNRRADDYFNDCGLLRLDLRSDYEYKEAIYDILSLITPPAFDLFDCRMIATKIPGVAMERKRAAEQLGFTATEETLTGGHDQKIYTGYYVLYR